MKWHVIVVGWSIPFFLTFSFSACRKPLELPALTVTGKNTMGCRVNGVVNAYRGKPSYFSLGVSFNYILLSHYASIMGNAKSKDGGDVYLQVWADPLNSDSLYTNLTGTHYDNDSGEYWVNVDDPFNYVAFIRIDDSVAAGLFQFRAYSTGGDSVHVTEGRFDIHR